MGRRPILALCLAAGCRSPQAPADLVLSGHVEATEVRVEAKVGGRIDQLAIAEGDRVARGQEVARIDPVDVRLALALGAAERDAAAAALALALAGSRREEVAEARAQLAQAEAELQGSERDLARLEALLARGSGTEKARDDARTRREVAAGRVAAARERLGRSRAGSRPEEIDGARARVAAAEARLAELEQRLADTVIASPASGVVTAKLVERGELVAPGAGLAVVTDLADAWLTVYVAEPDLGRVRHGQPARVTTDGGESRSGRVTLIAERAEFTPKNVQTRDERVKLVYRVRIALDNQDGLFKPGMPADATLALAGAGG